MLYIRYFFFNLTDINKGIWLISLQGSQSALSSLPFSPLPPSLNPIDPHAGAEFRVFLCIRRFSLPSSLIFPSLDSCCSFSSSSLPPPRLFLSLILLPTTSSQCFPRCLLHSLLQKVGRSSFSSLSLSPFFFISRLNPYFSSPIFSSFLFVYIQFHSTLDLWVCSLLTFLSAFTCICLCTELTKKVPETVNQGLWIFFFFFLVGIVLKLFSISLKFLSSFIENVYLKLKSLNLKSKTIKSVFSLKLNS